MSTIPIGTSDEMVKGGDMGMGPEPPKVGGRRRGSRRTQRAPKGSWMATVKQVMASNPGMPLGQAMKKAKSIYKKGGKQGGGSALTPAAYGGMEGGRRRRRGTRRSRRGGMDE